jgi:hypothetical protein
LCRTATGIKRPWSGSISSWLNWSGDLVDWYDREILPGADLDKEIQKNLDESDVLIAIVSQDYIASDYCWQKEMAEALRRHDEGTMTIIPVIYRPCRWQKTSLGKLKAIPTDGTAIQEWENKDRAWLVVEEEIERLVQEFKARRKGAAALSTETLPRALATESRAARMAADSVDITLPPAPKPAASARKYRAKRDFSDLERDNFVAECLDRIHRYFKKAIGELNAHDGLTGTIRLSVDGSFNCMVQNTRRKRGGSASISVGRQPDGRGGGIVYSHSSEPITNSYNGWFYIEDDSYELFLRGSSFFGDDREKLTAEQAAEIMWEDLLRRAEIDIAN